MTSLLHDERVVRLPVRDDPRLELDARHRPGATTASAGAVIAPPHPLYGGEMSHPVVRALGGVLAARGRATLRFDWRGAGASSGRPSGDPAHALDDYRAALDWLGERSAPPTVAAGYSFGALAAVASTRERTIGSLVLVAPPAGALDLAALDAFTGPVRIVVGEADALADADTLARIAAARPTRRLEVLAGEGHFFVRGTAELRRALDDLVDDLDPAP